MFGNSHKMRLRVRLLNGMSVATIALSVGAAGAQEVTQVDSRAGLEEIMVTAQKRKERIQDVPIAVTAMTGQSIEKLQAVSLLHLRGIVPSIQIGHFMNTPNTAVFSVRGIGVVEPDPFAGNTVSIVVDGVPQFFSMGALVELYDIDRVEVLRGPQGTLFGANTTGGVVNVSSAQPTGEFGGKAEVTLGNYNRLDLKMALDLPIAENVLAGRIAVMHHGRDGYHTNLVTGDDIGDRNVTALRPSLLWTPTSDFEAILTGEYVRARNDGPVVVNGGLPGEAQYLEGGTLVPGAVLPMYPSPCLPAGSPCKAPDKYFSASDSIDSRSEMDTYRATLTINWNNTPVGNATAITGYRDFTLLDTNDQDGTPVFFSDSERRTSGWQFSQEARTDVNLTDSINVTIGGFYMKTHYDHYQLFRIPFAFSGRQDNFQDQDNWSASAFAQSYIDLSDRLRLQAGVRYTHEKTAMTASTFNFFFPEGDVELRGGVPIGGFEVSDEKSWDNVGWKLGLDYRAMEDVLVYGHWSRGFKSGGFVGRVGIPEDIGPYEPEKVDTFEVGIKADWLNNRLRTNLAVFYTDYRDLQLAQLYFTEDEQGTLVQGNSILNVAKAEIKGVEFEATVVPVDGLNLSGSVAYLDATYKDFLFFEVTAQGDDGFRDLAGFRLQNAPKWAANLTATYEFPVGPGFATASGTYSYTSQKFLGALNNTARATIQPTHFVHATLDWTPDDERWSIGFWVRNLFDNRYTSMVYDAPGIFGSVNYTPPREWGGSFRYNF